MAVSRRRLLPRAAAFALVALLLSGNAVWADNLIADGDGIAPVAANAISFGPVCSGTAVDKTVILQIHKTGGSHFADGVRSRSHRRR